MIFFLLLHPMNIVPMRIKLIIVVFFASCLGVIAQTPPPPTTPPPPGLPLDDGIVLLLVLALVLGVFKIYQYRKRVVK